MPSLRIAVRNVGDQLSKYQSPILENRSVKDTDNTPMDQRQFFTSTPIKSTKAKHLPVDLNFHEESADSRSYSRGSSNIIRTRFSSTELRGAKTSNLTSANTTVIEQLQIMPDRVWERR